ncbi:MAG: hypothetical protein ACYTEE_11360 [Planctomycetota bacterium]|jgi:hypothetical protein
MSYCSIIEFEDGLPARETEYKNAWGGAARIWTPLYDTYLKDPNNEYDSWLSTMKPEKLWDLADRKDLPMHLRAVLSCTFDYATIEQKNFKRFAEDLRQFREHFPPNGVVCHLIEWAHHIEQSHAQAVGFYGTSVSDNLWWSYDEDTDQMIPYNLDRGEEHFEVYDWLLEIDGASP